MKKVIILHGTGGHPDSFWTPYLRDNLDSKTFDVYSPQLPNPDKPKLEEQLKYFQDNFEIDENTTLVGHSAGCPLILSIIEKSSIKIEKAVLVAGLVRPKQESHKEFMQGEYDWDKIKSSCGKFILINSKNDPWGCDDQEGLFIQSKIGGDIVIFENEGHMGSDLLKQKYDEFPLLKTLIES